MYVRVSTLTVCVIEANGWNFFVAYCFVRLDLVYKVLQAALMLCFAPMYVYVFSYLRLQRLCTDI